MSDIFLFELKFPETKYFFGQNPVMRSTILHVFQNNKKSIH